MLSRYIILLDIFSPDRIHSLPIMSPFELEDLIEKIENFVKLMVATAGSKSSPGNQFAFGMGFLSILLAHSHSCGAESKRG
jgi:hypothetical protein